MLPATFRLALRSDFIDFYHRILVQLPLFISDRSYSSAPRRRISFNHHWVRLSMYSLLKKGGRRGRVKLSMLCANDLNLLPPCISSSSFLAPPTRSRSTMGCMRPRTICTLPSRAAIPWTVWMIRKNSRHVAFSLSACACVHAYLGVGVRDRSSFIPVNW